MAKDDQGIAPKAKDGEPNGADADELKRRRELAAARERAEEEATGMSDHGDGDGKRGKPIDGQEPEIGEEDDGQMFVWEQGSKVTLGTLISRGVAVEHAFVFGGKRLKGRGGLVSFNDDVLVVCRGIVGKTSLVPTRDDQERVTKVVVETHIAAKVVVPADSEDGMSLLASVLEKRGARAA